MYLAPQNIPRAISVLTLGKKLYCIVQCSNLRYPSLISHLASVEVKQNVLVHPPRPLFPSVPAVAGCAGAAAGAPCVGEINSGESLHCFLVGVNECYSNH